PRALALVAGDRLGALRGTGRPARGAGHGRAHRHLVLAAEHRLGEVEVGDHLEIGAPGRARCPPGGTAEGAAPEERLEDVAETAAEPERVAHRPPVDSLGAGGVVAPAL